MSGFCTESPERTFPAASISARVKPSRPRIIVALSRIFERGSRAGLFFFQFLAQQSGFAAAVFGAILIVDGVRFVAGNVSLQLENWIHGGKEAPNSCCGGLRLEPIRFLGCGGLRPCARGLC